VTRRRGWRKEVNLRRTIIIIQSSDRVDRLRRERRRKRRVDEKI